MATKIGAVPTFRDLGGTAIAGLGRIRSGRVYRAGGLRNPSAEDRQRLAGLGIRTVIDLRSRGETELHASSWGEVCGARVLHCDVNRDVGAGQRELFGLLRSRPSEAGARRMMTETYRYFGQAFATHLPAIFAALLETPNLPAVIHCTAGKDRTGFACAMLLCALGADQTAVIEDYARTASSIDESIATATAEMLASYLGASPAPAVVRVMAGVEADYLEAALEGVRADFGSVDRYLETAGGLDRDRRRRLHELLLDQA